MMMKPVAGDVVAEDYGVHTMLIANYGDAAVDIIRECREKGIRSVAVYSSDDVKCDHVTLADEAVCIGDSRESGCYGQPYPILSAAELSGAEAVHVCGGPLSGDERFSELCAASGLILLDSEEALLPPEPRRKRGIIAALIEWFFKRKDGRRGADSSRVSEKDEKKEA